MALRRPVFLNAWSDSYLWREPQRCSWGDQVPDDSGNLVGHGRNGLGSTQFATQASVFVAEIAFIMMQRTGCHAQRLTLMGELGNDLGEDQSETTPQPPQFGRSADGW